MCVGFAISERVFCTDGLVLRVAGGSVRFNVFETSGKSAFGFGRGPCEGGAQITASRANAVVGALLCAQSGGQGHRAYLVDQDSGSKSGCVFRLKRAAMSFHP